MLTPMFVIFWLMSIAPFSVSAASDVDGATSPEQILESQWDRLPLDALHSFVRELDPTVRDHVPPLDFRSLIFDRDGFRWQDVGLALLNVFWSEITLNLALLGQLIVLGIFCAVLRVVASSMGGESSEVALLVSLLVLLLIGLHAFRSTVALASQTLDEMVGLLQALLPVMSMMLAAVGAVTTAAIFHPLVYTTVTAVATLVDTVLVPLVFISVALAVVGAVSQEFPLRHLEGLLKSGSLFLLGFCFIAFFAVVQARGLVAPVADGFAIRTVKFLTSTFIPVVGGRVADAMDMIVGGSVLIKNAIGLFGMGAVAVVTAFPIVKILSLLVIFRLAAAIVEPITDSRLVQAMSGLAGGIGLLAAGVITVALMFFVGITVLISVGNTAAVMR